MKAGRGCLVGITQGVRQMHDLSLDTIKPRESTKSMDHYRREKSFFQQWSLIDLNKGNDVVNVRFYGAAQTVYCVTWFHLWPYGFEGTCRGCGKAGGYGYHKASAAMQEALTDAGSIGGRGETAMQEALEVIAAHCGIARFLIHKAHG